MCYDTLMPFIIRIPALDRLIDFLEARQQAEIDILTIRIKAFTQELRKSNQALQAILNKTKEK